MAVGGEALDSLWFASDLYPSGRYRDEEIQSSVITSFSLPVMVSKFLMFSATSHSSNPGGKEISRSRYGREGSGIELFAGAEAAAPLPRGPCSDPCAGSDEAADSSGLFLLEGLARSLGTDGRSLC